MFTLSSFFIPLPTARLASVLVAGWSVLHPAYPAVGAVRRTELYAHLLHCEEHARAAAHAVPTLCALRVQASPASGGEKAAPVKGRIHRYGRGECSMLTVLSLLLGCLAHI